MRDEDSSSFKACNCLPDCNSIDYEFSLSHERFEMTNYSRLHIASATISFDGDEFIAYKRFTNHGTVAFLSNIGGLLGLFLGVSVLSIVEFLYFFTLRLINNLHFNNSSITEQ